ncbi:hypothetical protein IF188_15325 [Microbacterium sp. NEAU-LLC]|uniref:Spermidine/putrescine ABC transporter permease n=1 Tax=Microbacterium helvum TaxID=2773713 RepID=A0ABR8NQY8_9MICO|nr:hypothetical protein [Microbacterium helvum]MBD3943066.1 hypothetical protein [Microbacterium helvum]
MSTPTDPPQDELRALRARAYGPDADIQDDPVALARLRELEDVRRAASVERIASPVAEESMDAAAPAVPSGSLPVAPIPTPDTPDAPDTADTPASGDAPDANTSTAAPAPPDGIPDPEPATRRPWWRRRIPLLWAASVVAALVAGAGLMLWMQGIDSGHIAVLHVDPDEDWPETWGAPTEGALTFEAFHGLTVLSQPQPAFGDGLDTVPCLTVFSAIEGTITYGGGSCGAGPFPATAAFVIDTHSPAELREAFGIGTALQFVLDGDRVHVYAKGPGALQSTP